MGASTGAGERSSRTQLLKELATSPHLPSGCSEASTVSPRWDRVSPSCKAKGCELSQGLEGLGERIRQVSCFSSC